MAQIEPESVAQIEPCYFKLARFEPEPLALLNRNGWHKSNRISHLKSDDIRKLFSDIETEIDKLKLKTDKEVEQLLSSKKNSLTDEDYENEVRWKTKGRRLNITLSARDGSEYKGQTFKILESDGIINAKQIVQVRFYYDDDNHDVSIQVHLRHTEYDDWNKIEIKGRDSIWVNGLMRKLEDNINLWEKQNTFVKRYKWLIYIILVLCIGFVFERIIETIIQLIPTDGGHSSEGEKKLNKEAAQILLYFMSCSMATFPALIVGDKIKNLWLSVELHTGQEYNLTEKQRRFKLWSFITLIIVPTIISIIASL